jgi:hypothetical protein
MKTCARHANRGCFEAVPNPVAEKTQSNFVAAFAGTVRRAPGCVGGGLGEPSPFPHPKYLAPPFPARRAGPSFCAAGGTIPRAPAAFTEDDQPAYLRARPSCSCCLSFVRMNQPITVNSYTMLASTIIIATAIKVIVLMRARSSSVSPDANLLIQPAVSSRIGAS